MSPWTSVRLCELLPTTLIAQLLAINQKPVVVYVALMMTKKVEQCICMKFCQQLGHSCSQTYSVIQKTFETEATGLGGSWRDIHQSRKMNVHGGSP
jgi:hypothetical protein